MYSSGNGTSHLDHFNKLFSHVPQVTGKAVYSNYDLIKSIDELIEKAKKVKREKWAQWEVPKGRKVREKPKKVSEGSKQIRASKMKLEEEKLKKQRDEAAAKRREELWAKKQPKAGEGYSGGKIEAERKPERKVQEKYRATQPSEAEVAARKKQKEQAAFERRHVAAEKQAQEKYAQTVGPSKQISGVRAALFGAKEGIKRQAEKIKQKFTRPEKDDIPIHVTEPIYEKKQAQAAPKAEPKLVVSTHQHVPSQPLAPSQTTAKPSGKPQTMTDVAKPQGLEGQKPGSTAAQPSKPKAQPRQQQQYAESGPGSGRLAAVAGGIGAQTGGSPTATAGLTHGVPAVAGAVLSGGRQKIPVGPKPAPPAPKEKVAAAAKSFSSTIRSPGMMRPHLSLVKEQPPQKTDQSGVFLYISDK